MGFQFNQIFRSTIKNPLPLCCLIWVPKKPLYGILGSKKSHFLSLFIMIYSNLEKSLFFNFSTSFSISLCVGVSFGWFRFCYHLFFFFFFGDSDLLLFFSVNKEKVTECFSIVDDLLNFVIVVFWLWFMAFSSLFVSTHRSISFSIHSIIIQGLFFSLLYPFVSIIILEFSISLLFRWKLYKLIKNEREG